MRVGRIGAALMLCTALFGHPASAATRDAQLWQAASAARAGELALLKAAVNIDSGTGDREGARRVEALMAPRLSAIGAAVHTAPSEDGKVGDNLLATLPASPDASPSAPSVLIIAHVDTVFPAPEAEKRPYAEKGDRASGPGVSDEKAGVVEAVNALELLTRLHRPHGRITLLLEAGEETGSPGARRLIGQLAHDAQVELNMEPGDEPDTLTVWRKGSTTYTLTVHGRAAHAGVDPQDGRNAAAELVHQLAPVDAMPHSGDGLTANLTTLKAGDRVNVIPDLATASVNVRVRSAAEFSGVEQVLKAAAAHPAIAGTRVDVTSTPAFPPLADNAGTQALAKRAQTLYVALGRPLLLGGNGGASESALASAAGAVALDGLGPVGGGFHSDREYLELATVTPRLYLLAALLADLGVDGLPPVANP